AVVNHDELAFDDSSQHFDVNVRERLTERQVERPESVGPFHDVSAQAVGDPVSSKQPIDRLHLLLIPEFLEPLANDSFRRLTQGVAPVSPTNDGETGYSRRGVLENKTDVNASIPAFPLNMLRARRWILSCFSPLAPAVTAEPTRNGGRTCRTLPLPKS